jgi:hypothetical protein
MIPEAKPKLEKTPPTRSFLYQQVLDHSVIKKTIDKVVKGSKFGQTTCNDRKDLVRETVKDKLDQRERANRNIIAGREYPEQFNQEAEMQYYLKHVSRWINMPTERTARRSRG